MKISYTHLVEKIENKPTISEISEKLLQLGHEHELENTVFDMEFTPNRGDCLSLNGLLRDLRLFYDINTQDDIFKDAIDPLKIEFVNKAKDNCSKISFLKIDIDEVPTNYEHMLESYFTELKLSKNNFFTDISNYISYETGQPTHCYDFSKLNNYIKLDFLEKESEFETLLGKIITIDKGEMVFLNNDREPINLAGIMGGKSTSCDEQTKSVLIECAHFDPESIIGKSTKYSVNSEAAYKFERNTDSECHDYVLRRFIKIVENNTNINKVELFTETNRIDKPKTILLDTNLINKILGTDVSLSKCIELLERLDFKIEKDLIYIPSFRNDISHINDIAEEIARAIGYDNVKPQSFNISLNKNNKSNENPVNLINLLIDNGFNEVINNPFVLSRDPDSIEVDNPLDSNRKFLRTSLKDSLVKNLIYNERRQKESLKLFEIADIYSNNDNVQKRFLGVIASGRVDKNYKDFSRKINNDYMAEIFSNYMPNIEFSNISRNDIKSKSKNTISYFEIDISSLQDIDYFSKNTVTHIDNKKYIPISDFPCSTRDISFSILDADKCIILENYIVNISHELLKEAFIFDYFNNEKANEIKIGVRFIFQSNISTVTDDEVNDVMETIIDGALSINSISIPGFR